MSQDLSSFGGLDMTKQWCNALVVPIMFVNSRHLYEHSTIGYVCPLRLAHHNNIPPQHGARFHFDVHYDEWSEYIAPVAYSLQEQQRIINWNTVRGLKLSGDGLTYIQ